jgi:valyl-tRNA synthetase
MEFERSYNPKTVEDKIYRLWLRSGFFNPDNLPKRHKKPYTIVIPPPNITGELHMGHALNTVVQDILIRWRRMQGFKTLWLPGTDHAGIATQNVVEKKLKKEGKTRFDLGREKFIKEVWDWKEKYGDIILNQFKKLGASCDWSRTRFTMDKGYSQAVKEAFLHYYKKGLIYRGKKVINWCPRCATSLSDLELEYKEEKGRLWYIKYPMSKKSKFQNPNSKIQNYITVATTRPETMLGDTAVAVNPKDKRYKKLVGRRAILPLVNREILIIADRLVDSKFGTGAVKVTPAHDLRDYEIGQRHNLKIVQVIDEKGKITKEAPAPYQELGVSEARKKVVEDLKNQGLLEKVENYLHQVPRCYRCETTVELVPSWQWFLKMGELAKKAEKPVKEGKIKFYPKSFQRPYFEWLKNIKDWCISRQIWWGHQLPIWHCEESERKIKNTISKMGFAGTVVPQVFDNKTRTYRLRNHHLKVGDRVLFENSATGEIFGTATITEVKKTIVGKINLKDKKHWRTYKKMEELIAAFKRHHPEKEVSASTPAWIYTYKFEDVCPIVVDNKYAFKKCPYCKIGMMKQVDDVLDTWFSSALWPFATLGWPKKTKGLKDFYPTDVLSTARDIINLWVARMIFSGMEFMKKNPFKDVYIHATVLTREGRRMSKSLGTGIDPMKLIEEYGSDSTRFGIAYQIMKGQDIKFVPDNIVMGKKFCNKIWNASRFVLQQIGNTKFKSNPLGSLSLRSIQQNLTPADKRILKALDKTTKSVNKDLESFRFGKAAHTLYNFFWHDFCDRYLEESKKQNDKKTKKILLHVLFTSLKLLHPFMPFITEEIKQKLPIKNKKLCLMIEEYPQ